MSQKKRWKAHRTGTSRLETSTPFLGLRRRGSFCLTIFVAIRGWIHHHPPKKNILRSFFVDREILLVFFGAQKIHQPNFKRPEKLMANPRPPKISARWEALPFHSGRLVLIWKPKKNRRQPGRVKFWRGDRNGKKKHVASLAGFSWKTHHFFFQVPISYWRMLIFHLPC